MDLMHLTVYITLLFYLCFALIAETTARPITDVETFISTPLDIDRHFNDGYLAAFKTRPVAAKDSLISRLRRGYYYIEDGQIIPINPLVGNKNAQKAHRRQDSFPNDSVENIKTKKRLFVPNLFG